jgi:hypothetical protein
LKANLIPASYFAAGSLMWESDSGIVYWRLSWGGAAYTGPCTGNTANGVDYRRLSGSATIRSGATKAAITVKPIDDTIPEPDETVILTLSPDANYIIGSPSTATVTIHSNE